jgi:hypothetical protein
LKISPTAFPFSNLFSRRSFQNGKAIGGNVKMGRREEKSSKWEGERRHLQNGKAIGEIFKMERR